MNDFPAPNDMNNIKAKFKICSLITRMAGHENFSSIDDTLTVFKTNSFMQIVSMCALFNFGDNDRVSFLGDNINFALPCFVTAL